MSESLAQYQQDLRRFSDELIRIQTPIKILDAIKWPREMEERFLSNKGTVLPAIKQEFYQNIALPFDPVKTQAELASLKQDIHRRLGKRDKLGKILVANVDQYRLVIDKIATDNPNCKIIIITCVRCGPPLFVFIEFVFFGT